MKNDILRNKSKIRFSVVLLSFLLILCCFGFVAVKFNVFATTPATIETALQDSSCFKTGGASVRLNNDDSKSGIRFRILLRKDVYDTYMLNEEGSVKYSTGIIVLPEDKKPDSNAITVETDLVQNADTTENWILSDEVKNGYEYMENKAYMPNIPTESLARNLCVRGYVKIGDSYYYTEEMSRSLYGVALIAYNDGESYSEQTKEKILKYIDPVAGFSVAQNGAVTVYNAVDSDWNYIYDQNALYQPNVTATVENGQTKIVFPEGVKVVKADLAEGLTMSFNKDSDGNYETLTVTGIDNRGQAYQVKKSEIEAKGGYTLDLATHALYTENTTLTGGNILRSVNKVPNIDESGERYYLYFKQVADGSRFVFRSYDGIFDAGEEYITSFTVNSDMTKSSGYFHLMQFDGNGNQAAQETALTSVTSADGKWVTYSCRFTASENTAFTGLYLTGTTKAEFYLKEVNFAKVDVTIEGGFTASPSVYFPATATSGVSAATESYTLNGVTENYLHVTATGAGNLIFNAFDGLFKNGYTYTIEINAYAPNLSSIDNRYVMCLKSSGAQDGLPAYRGGNNGTVGIAKYSDGWRKIMHSFTVGTDLMDKIAFYNASGSYEMYIYSVTIFAFEDTRTVVTPTASNLEYLNLDFNLRTLSSGLLFNSGTITASWCKYNGTLAWHVLPNDTGIAGTTIRFADIDSSMFTAGNTYKITLRATDMGSSNNLTVLNSASVSKTRVQKGTTADGKAIYEYGFEFSIPTSGLLTVYHTSSVLNEFYLFGVRIENVTVEQTVSSKVDKVVEVETGRDVRVLQLTDTQIIDTSQRSLNAAKNETWAKDKVDYVLFRYIKDAVERTNPDLILITGDLIYGSYDNNGSALIALIDYMESFRIPWAPIFGNHENESAMGVAWQCTQLENATYCLFERGTTDGNCNYSVGIVQGGELVRVFYMLDSNGCAAAYGKDDVEDNGVIESAGFTQNQINWLGANMNALLTVNPNVEISLCYHIPTYTVLQAFKNQYTGDNFNQNFLIGGDVESKNGDFGMYRYESAFNAMNVSIPYYNNTDYLTLLQNNNVDSVFMGHLHQLNTSVLYGGIRWTFGLKTGRYDEHATDEVGGTLITFNADSFSVKHIYYDEAYQAEMDALREGGTYTAKTEWSFDGDDKAIVVDTGTVEGYDNGKQIALDNQTVINGVSVPSGTYMHIKLGYQKSARFTNFNGRFEAGETYEFTIKGYGITYSASCPLLLYTQSQIQTSLSPTCAYPTVNELENGMTEMKFEFTATSDCYMVGIYNIDSSTVQEWYVSNLTLKKTS